MKCCQSLGVLVFLMAIHSCALSVYHYTDSDVVFVDNIDHLTAIKVKETNNSDNVQFVNRIGKEKEYFQLLDTLYTLNKSANTWKMEVHNQWEELVDMKYYQLYQSYLNRLNSYGHSFFNLITAEQNSDLDSVYNMMLFTNNVRCIPQLSYPQPFDTTQWQFISHPDRLLYYGIQIVQENDQKFLLPKSQTRFFQKIEEDTLYFEKKVVRNKLKYVK